MSLPAHLGAVERRGRLVATLIVAIHAGLLAYSAAIHSPTINEPAHLASGIALWTHGTFALYRVNPPLARAIAALPVLGAGCRTDWKAFYDGPGARPEFAVGNDFVLANGDRAFHLVSLARFALIPVSMVAAWIVFRWANALYGQHAGLAAIALYCFSPTILGHASLITPDATAAACAVAAAYSFWLWLREPTWWRAAASGLVLGVALLAKTTLLVLLIASPLAWVLSVLFSRRVGSPVVGREVAMLAAQAVLALYVLNLGYLFTGTGRRWGEFEFVSRALRSSAHKTSRAHNSLSSRIPVPLPADYVLGIDAQRRDFERGEQPSYLRGDFQERGWWYYYLYAGVVKEPLGLWALVALALIVRRRALLAAPPCDTLALALPPMAIFALVSSQDGFSIHYRYALPALPFVLIGASQLFSLHEPCPPVVRLLAAAALAWYVGISLLTYPHSLSYFNELAGGPRAGPRHLLGSNVDWGQDLLGLRDWARRHPAARPLKIACLGYYSAEQAGFDFELPAFTGPANGEHSSTSDELPPGLYAVSVNLLHGAQCDVPDRFGQRRIVPSRVFERLRTLEPIDYVGYSIAIYAVGLSEEDLSER